MLPNIIKQKQHIINNMQFKFLFSALITFAFCSNYLVAQERTHYLDGNVSLGTLLDIYPNSPTSTRVVGGEFSWLSQTNDSLSYPFQFGNPITGVTLGFYDLGNPSILGQTLNLQYSISFHKQIAKRLSWEPGLRMGAAYFNKPYHYIENTENIVMGSHFAFWISAVANVYFDINPNWKIYTGVRFQHSSNSHTALPNVGANVPAFHLGTRYEISKKTSSSSISKLKSSIPNTWQLGGRFEYGIYELGETTSPTNGLLYSVYTAAIYTQKNTGNIGRVRLGVEGYYNRGFRDLLETIEYNNGDVSFMNSSIITPFIGYEFLYGRWALYTQLGYNIQNTGLAYWIDGTTEGTTMDQLKKVISGRYGVHCYLLNPYDQPSWNMYIGMHIKSMVLQADFLAFTVGAHFGKTKADK